MGFFNETSNAKSSVRVNSKLFIKCCESRFKTEMLLIAPKHSEA